MANPKVLLIDDTPAALKLLTLIFGSLNWDYDTAQDGEQALEKILAQPADTYSIIVSDWLMPKIDGLELLKQIKADPQRRHIPVILQTALADKASTQKGLKEGAFYYLTKPLDLELVQSVALSALKDANIHKRLRTELNKITYSFNTVEHAEFRFQTRQQAQGLATLIAGIAQDPEEAVVGLFELMINAIEHGNLEISYDEKTQLISNNSLMEEVENRLAQAPFNERFATLEIRNLDQQFQVTITDMGKGFDFENYLEFSIERALDNHGRGIMMAMNAGFEEVEYQLGGRQVQCTLPKP